VGRLIGWLIGAPLAAAAAVFAVANRTSVVADLWPLPWSVEAPLYLFVLFALVVLSLLFVIRSAQGMIRQDCGNEK